MIKTHNEFLKTIKGQRPDSLLSRQPDAPRLIGWVEYVRDLSMNTIWFLLPIIVGVVIIWFDGSILSINN
uniref:Uncharacterized protein n=1 Tax=Amphimedon queenslandica TaxID=400682 RepID=A0A1X7U1I7_AMPQE